MVGFRKREAIRDCALRVQPRRLERRRLKTSAEGNNAGNGETQSLHGN